MTLAPAPRSALDLAAEDAEATASRLGITPNNLKVRHHRARQALRKRLEDLCGACAAGHCHDCDCHRQEARSSVIVSVLGQGR